MIAYELLKSRQREIRDSFGPSLSLRVHRALSWLNRAEQETDDQDGQFLFLWVAFNAAYANEINNRRTFSERRLLFQFLKRMVQIDRDHLLYEVVWDQFTSSIRLLIQNKYVFQPFWDFQNGLISEDEWRSTFDRSIAAANRALGKTDTIRVLAVIFDRLYTLRNQVIHGGATWNSGVNRDQIRDGANILGHLVPIIIHLMMENHNLVWGDPCYPVVD